MKLLTQPYLQQMQIWPESGKHIMAQYNSEFIIVYQAYKKEIGEFAALNQSFGNGFSFNRMTWIKPNFLWMMYRNGWGTKVYQETTLAIYLKLSAFEQYLENAVISSYKPGIHADREIWQNEIKQSNVRLQWDPDHDPYGKKLNRKAIQIGLRKNFIHSFAKEDIIEILDISPFVKEQYHFVQNNQLNQLITPEEKPFLFANEALNNKLSLDRV